MEDTHALAADSWRATGLTGLIRARCAPRRLVHQCRLPMKWAKVHESDAHFVVSRPPQAPCRQALGTRLPLAPSRRVHNIIPRSVEIFRTLDSIRYLLCRSSNRFTHGGQLAAAKP